jgi:hypothetical protein
MGILALEEKYERVRKEYAEKEAIGIPMSVRERYERRLVELRQKLEEAGRSDVIQRSALAEQAVRNRKAN